VALAPTDLPDPQASPLKLLLPVALAMKVLAVFKVPVALVR
jgi:hypothetical protein